MELLEKSNVLGMLSEVISEGIIIVDEQRQITASNNAANIMFAYEAGELPGKSLDILIPKHARSNHETKVAHFMSKGKARQMGQGLDLVGLRKDGEEFPLEISLSPFELHRKKYVLALVMDITERKKAEQTIDYWFQIFDESLNEIFVFDTSSFVFINVNRGAQLNLGYTMEELNKMSVLDIKPDVGLETMKRLLSPLLSKRKQKVIFESLHKRKDGTTYPVEVHLQLSFIGKRQVCVAIVLDITERKNYTKQLEDTVAERTQQLQEALKAEKKLNELKTKFLSLVSHEFKTPLTSILTSTSLLGKYTESDQQEKRDKHIVTIKSKVKHLDNILTDFLSIERLELGKVSYTITTFPLSKLINEVVYDSNTLLKEGQRIRYPNNIDGVVVEFDEKILGLALSNLVHNAIKYSPEDTDIELKVSQEREQLNIQVVDEGFGIPSEDQPFVFDRYFRASNVLTVQGTGIGLNTVRQHMHNLDANITFKSKYGSGSTFTLHIPINKKQNEKNFTG
ncbi:PAS domain-containing sensor histidine kinase [Allomuricauda sp. F6463D]|uniref:sensor histidine kinase n=1 Tax=Allomuricauda sp. F6463D TaxID=2926409 RepID=UPI001FF58714|nr:PAS domain-containing sensor histidine kinase [Muricauda sp. F6463D]MCK0159244.1 PAS domain-containing sensor histidine kinase [Muricauda sp. F6463D]